jgi:hypothetical protein
VSSDNRLGGNSTDGKHSKTSVKKLRVSLLLHFGGILGSHHGPSKVTGFSVSILGGNNSGSSDNKVEKSNKEKKLEHGSISQESIVGINSLGDGFERIHFSWKSDKVGGNESNNRQHGGSSVTKFGLAEERKERFISLSELEAVAFEKSENVHC